MRATLALVCLLGVACAGEGPPSKREASQDPVADHQIAPDRGLRVLRAREDSEGHLAGVRPGDWLLAWGRAGEATSPRTPLETVPQFLALEAEGTAQAPLELDLVRGSESRTVTLRGTSWGLAVRPHFGELEQDDEAVAALESDDFGTVAEDLLRMTDAAPEHRAWLEYRAASARLASGDEETFEEATRAASELEDPVARAWLHVLHAQSLSARSRHALAVRHLERAVSMFADVAPQSLGHARAIDALGLARIRNRSGREGLRDLERALEMRRAIAPTSPAVADSLTHLGNYSPDFKRQLELQEEALLIRRQVAPDGIDVAKTLNNLGNLSWSRGRLAQAIELLGEAEQRFAALGVGGRVLAAVRGNMALVARDRGDLALAEEQIRETLAYFAEQEPRSRWHAETLTILGGIQRNRRDLRGAEQSMELALEIWNEVEPGGSGAAIATFNLGNVALNQGDHERAEELYREVLRIRRESSPQLASEALALNALGSLIRRDGRPEEAQPLLLEARQIIDEQAPEGVLANAILGNVGHVVRDLDGPAAAIPIYEEGLRRAQRRAPDTLLAAKMARDLARALRDDGRTDAALRYFALALETLERQVGRAGNSEDERSEYRAGHVDMYREYVDLLVAEGLVEQAFAAVERSRARGFLELLASRDLTLTDDVAPELEDERRSVRLEVDRVQARLLRASDPQQVKDLRLELAELRARRAAVLDEIRATSPRLASLRAPEPIALAEAQASLPTRATALIYSVGEDKAQLLVLTASDLRAVTLPVSRADLERDIDRFRLLLSSGHGSESQAAALREVGHGLFDRLLRPAATEVEAASRLVFVLDGPLHRLPLAALPLPADAGLEGSYLAEARPMVSSLSMTTFRELQQKRLSEPSGSRLVAFGDPKLSGAASHAGLRIAESGLGELPFSRSEVLGIRTHFSAADTYLGEDAAEETAKGVEGRVPYLHFATHGVIDDLSPMDSGLILASPAAGSKDNGFLQVWEIFEDLRVDADLVTLSACETGLGSELDGEGLIGLTRAFQFAGAKRVLASHWRVSDRSTSQLMKELYEALDEGLDLDVALQQAQLRLIRGEPERTSWLDRLLPWRQEAAQDTSHPFHWAAFQIHGPP